ncbi:hypothetical protein LMG33810_002422 [Carnimonas sp. LMG 33810]
MFLNFVWINQSKFLLELNNQVASVSIAPMCDRLEFSCMFLKQFVPKVYSMALGFELSLPHFFLGFRDFVRHKSSVLVLGKA